MTTFTPISALIGGLLIGGAAVWLLLLNGRIAGVSGIVAGLVAPHARDSLDSAGWRVLFLLGLIGGAAMWAALGGAHLSHHHRNYWSEETGQVSTCGCSTARAACCA
jgi:uncharacterized membrane protein YedE/YeeE